MTVGSAATATPAIATTATPVAISVPRVDKAKRLDSPIDHPPVDVTGDPIRVHGRLSCIARGVQPAIACAGMTGEAGHSERAARLMDLLGLTEDELCRTLDVDPLTLLSGQLDHSAEL